MDKLATTTCVFTKVMDLDPTGACVRTCVRVSLSTIVTKSDNEGLIALHSFVCLYQCNGNWYLTDFSAIRTTMCTNITDKNIP